MVIITARDYGKQMSPLRVQAISFSTVWLGELMASFQRQFPSQILGPICDSTPGCSSDFPTENFATDLYSPSTSQPWERFNSSV
jgi:hypothetical protein